MNIGLPNIGPQRINVRTCGRDVIPSDWTYDDADVPRLSTIPFGQLSVLPFDKTVRDMKGNKVGELFTIGNLIF